MILDYWDNFSFNKIKVTEDCENILFLGENEWEMWFDRTFAKKVIEHDVHIDFVTSELSPTKYNLQNIKKHNLENNIKIHRFPTYWFLYSLCDIAFDLKKTRKIKYDFVCLNNNPHLHRCLFIDEIYKNNLQNNAAITWHQTENYENYKFKYFHNKKLTLSNDNFHKDENVAVKPTEYYESFFEMVTESTYEVPFITEKTVRPILFKKPFMVLGARNHHKYLKSFGFKLYEDIIDYSFDDESDLEKRVFLIGKELEKIKKIRSNRAKLRYITKVSNYNYHHYWTVIRNKKYYPKIILDNIGDIEGDHSTDLKRYEAIFQRIKDFGYNAKNFNDWLW